MSDRVSEELSMSAKSLRQSRECFIEVYIDNQLIIIIIFAIFPDPVPVAVAGLEPYTLG
jgi:hypothetical protein